MTLSKTTTHEITFTVEAFWDEEGGMGNDSFGDEQKDLPSAVQLLELARVARPKELQLWVIVARVKTTTK